MLVDTLCDCIAWFPCISEHFQALALALRQSEASRRLKDLEAIFDSMEVADRRVDVGGAVIEALIMEHGKNGSFDKAKRVFDMVEGPTDGPCLRALLSACATSNSGPRWEEVSP
jgi:hypothetical protein